MMLIFYVLPWVIVMYAGGSMVMDIWQTKKYNDWRTRIRTRATNGTLVRRIFLTLVGAYTPILNFIVALAIVFEKGADFLDGYLIPWLKKEL